MRHFGLFALALLLSCPALAQVSSAEVESQAAQAAFHDTDFFADGRGMMLSPGLITAYNLAIPGIGVFDDKMFANRWGLVYDDTGKISGLHDKTFNSHRIGVIGCVACHSGRAAGQYIVGLGNKTIDVLQLGRDVNNLETFWRATVPAFMKDKSYVEAEDYALHFSAYLANENLGNLTQGLVPVSFIRGWFYRIQNEPVPADMPKGQVKVPFLWGFAEKRKAGQFCDGFGDGSVLGWLPAVELTSGQHPDTVRAYYGKVEATEQLFEKFLPPKYPFAIDENLAAQGKAIFENTCAHCHGTYNYTPDGLPIFEQPKRIPWHVVRTDNDRLLGNTPAFIQLVGQSPLNDLIKVKYSDPGYFAPRLNGIWARFPYLHNGSVPTIADLLSPEESRPEFFSLHDVGEKYRFDQERIGLTAPDPSDEESLHEAAVRGDRDVYWTKRIGHSNTGHPFYTGLPADQKTALLEYLKTL